MHAQTAAVPDLAAALDAGTMALAIVDRAGRLVWLNGAFATCVGTAGRRLAGTPLALHAAAFDAPLRRARDEQRRVLVRELPLDETDLRIDAALSPLDDGAVLVELRETSESVAAPAADLSASLRGFAHEVKNPLAGMRGAAQLLQRRLDDPALVELAGLVVAEVDRLAALADRLLRSDGTARPQPLNVHELTERVLVLAAAEPGAPTIRRDYDPSLPPLLGDADRLHQLLLNLVRNACEAGATTLTVRTRAEHGLRLGTRACRVGVRIDVGDDGCGVPEALAQTLFQPLVSGRADGSGLGLALAHQIAREHGGELRWHSRPGATVFSLLLPIDGLLPGVEA